MSVVIMVGKWVDNQGLAAKTSGYGQISRPGFSISWARPLDPKILFSLKVHIALAGGQVMEQSFMLREI